MLKELTVLVIVLWGSLGMPTPTPSQDQELSRLIKLYCRAEALLRVYKADDDKYLPSEARPTLASVFSQPGCNFTKQAEECQIHRAFRTLFLWLQSTYPQEGLLVSVMEPFNQLIHLQKRYISEVCLEEPSDEAPQITCPTYSSGKPALENKFHYIFELYRNQTDSLWRSKFPENQRDASDVCGAKDS